MNFCGFHFDGEGKATIETLTASGRLPHAVIIESKDQKKAGEAAALLSAYAVCQEQDKPCGVCRQCQNALNHTHADIRNVEPDKSGKTKTYKIDQIRALARDAQIRPNDADAKVYIFEEADTQFPEISQNAFLKLLEEPPAYVTFLLCAENPERLLPTVRSRCAELRMGGPAPEADKAVRTRAEAWLESLGDAAGVLRASLALEKLDGAALLEVVRAAMDLAPSRGLAPAELLELEAFLRRAEEYLRANVGVRHVIGYLSTYGYEKN